MIVGKTGRPERAEISTGNDIVALNAIDRRRTVEPRFYSKIISPIEQELYSTMGVSSLLLENFIWLIWSIKESTYKYWQRIIPDLIFSPARISVRQLDSSHLSNVGMTVSGAGRVYRGMVHAAAGSLYSRSTVTADHISTVVGVGKGFDGIWSGVSAIDSVDPAFQSASVRSFLLENLRSLLPGGGEDLRIEKGTRGCPILYKGEKEAGIPISLAHHGRFIAYSFAWNQWATGGSGGPDLPGILPDKVFPAA
jgi:phosphopantetheinyl transferase (holo-ACP synthase)